MKKMHPTSFDFVPTTWQLPCHYEDLRRESESNPTSWFIKKPYCGC